jgi:hypothetical protein
MSEHVLYVRRRRRRTPKASGPGPLAWLTVVLVCGSWLLWWLL